MRSRALRAAWWSSFRNANGRIRLEWWTRQDQNLQQESNDLYLKTGQNRPIETPSEFSECENAACAATTEKLAEPRQNEPEPATGKKRKKPAFKKLSNAVLSDSRLNLSDLFLLSWRARHSRDWTSRPQQLEREHGFGSDLFYASMNKLKALGYIDRKQRRDAKTGVWGHAKEKLDLNAAPANGRPYYTLIETDIAGMPWRQAAMLDYLRSHAETFVENAKDIGRRFGLSAGQVRKILKPLRAQGLVEVRIIRERGTVSRKGYSARPAAKAPCEHFPNAGFAMCAETGVHNKAQPYNSLPGNNPQVLPSSKSEKVTPREEAAVQVPFLDEESIANTTSARAKRAAQKRREIEKLYQRTGIDMPFPAPETFEEAAAHVTARMQKKINAGVQIDGEGRDGAIARFLDGIGAGKIEETRCITDKALREGIERATEGRVKKDLLGSEGLLSARRLIARIMQDDAPPEEALGAVLSEIRKAVADEGRRLNSWKLITLRLAGKMYRKEAESILIGDDGVSLPEKFRAADWNRVLAPSLFTAKGLAGLRRLIRTHGAESVDKAVSEYVLRGIVDREIERGHVRGWRYFEPAIKEQSNRPPELQCDD